MRKLMMLVAGLVLLTGVLPTASAQCENCPTPTAPPSGSGCPEPIAVAESFGIGHIWDVSDSGVVVYMNGYMQTPWTMYMTSLTGDFPAHQVCTDCGGPVWLDESTQMLFFMQFPEYRVYRVPFGEGGTPQLTQYPGGDGYISSRVTEDNEYLVFIKSQTNNSVKMYRANAADENAPISVTDLAPITILNVHEASGFEYENVVFLHTHESIGIERPAHLYAQPNDGGDLISLTGDLFAGDSYRFGGSYVYYSLTEMTEPDHQTMVLYRVGMDGTGLMILGQIQDPVYLNFDISPDGQTLVYRNGQTLYAAPTDGSNPEQPLKFYEFVDSVQYNWVFTPDSQAVLVTKYGNIYRVPLTGGEPQLLTSQPLGDFIGIQPDYFGDWMIHDGTSQPDAEVTYASVLDIYLIPADGNGSVVKFATARMVGGGYGELYLKDGERLIFVNSGEGISGIYTATLDDLVTGGQDSQLMPCTTTQGFIRLFGVYNHLLLYIVHSETASQMFAVPLE
ncbi:MAG: DUF5050 domain-containing protein [Anaerolineae bacterium]|nr:DUF5050 domain-containing protein [Anaerolineae bacterium]